MGTIRQTQAAPKMVVLKTGPGDDIGKRQRRRIVLQAMAHQQIAKVPFLAQEPIAHAVALLTRYGRRHPGTPASDPAQALDVIGKAGARRPTRGGGREMHVDQRGQRARLQPEPMDVGSLPAAATMEQNAGQIPGVGSMRGPRPRHQPILSAHSVHLHCVPSPSGGLPHSNTWQRSPNIGWSGPRSMPAKTGWRGAPGLVRTLHPVLARPSGHGMPRPHRPMTPRPSSMAWFPRAARAAAPLSFKIDICIFKKG